MWLIDEQSSTSLNCFEDSKRSQVDWLIDHFDPQEDFTLLSQSQDFTLLSQVDDRDLSLPFGLRFEVAVWLG